MGEAVLLPVAPDELQGLRRLIEEGLKSDLLLMTGGVSMGRYDLVEQALSEMQRRILLHRSENSAGTAGRFWQVWRARPARERPATYFFGLPGNPVSTMVTFELFARPMLEALGGQSPRKLLFLHARLKTEIRVKTGLKRFLPADPFRRIRTFRGRLGGLAGFWGHCRDRARKLLHRHPAGPRAHSGRGMGRGYEKRLMIVDF